MAALVVAGSFMRFGTYLRLRYIPIKIDSVSGPIQAAFCRTGPASIGNILGKPIDKNAICVATPLPIIAIHVLAKPPARGGGV